MHLLIISIPQHLVIQLRLMVLAQWLWANPARQEVKTALQLAAAVRLQPMRKMPLRSVPMQWVIKVSLSL
ncbi:hypothetical protein HMPREF2606_01220 [Neisseria sp. HMSC070H10]|nr:hypothetical protein HMPREF2606_01220 [Neisseria sp. HMSC070H10]